MTDTADLRYLYRKQESTGIWIYVAGPFESFRAALDFADSDQCGPGSYQVGICTSEDGRDVITGVSKMKCKYHIILVGSEEPDGSRLITCKSPISATGDILFQVEPKYLKEYMPNAGDTLVRDDTSGAISFEPRE